MDFLVRINWRGSDALKFLTIHLAYNIRYSGWMKSVLRVFAWLFFIILLGAATAAGGVFYVLYHYGADLPDYRQLANYDPPVVTRLYAQDGRLLTEYAKQKRVFVPITAIPKRVSSAFLAAEDKNFYTHPGVDFLGIARAMVENLKHIREGRRPKGASTITQQVAKNFLLGNQLSLDRKIKEAILAMRMEKTFSKDKILELYLNEIYLGGGSYGVAAAAMDYFNKSLDDLTIAETAYLAALPKAPNNYNPVKDRDAAIERRNWVIDRMLEDGVIKPDEARAAKLESLITRKRDDVTYVNAEYFTDEVRRQLIAQYGENNADEGGLTVRTTLDPKIQETATRVLRDGLMAYDNRHGWHGVVGEIHDLQQWQAGLKAIPKPRGAGDWQLAAVLALDSSGALIGLEDGATARMTKDSIAIAHGDLHMGQVVLVAPEVDAKKSVVLGRYALRQIPKVQGGIVVMEPHTGRVLAMTGGFSHDISVYNRATQAMRQPGSSFKPFVYLAALEQGFLPTTLILDAPVTYDVGVGQGAYAPGNYHDNFLGPTTVRQAIEKSRNVVTVRTADYIGIDKVAEIAERFGIVDKMPPVLSEALGAGETTVWRMATAYAELINNGKKVTPTVIDRIQDRNGKTLYRHDTEDCAACANNTWADGVTTPTVTDNAQQLTHPWHAYQIVNILQGVVERGTAKSLSELDGPIAGKTGTTNDSKDTWFVGATTDLVVAVYVGYDQPATMGKKETGASVAVPIVKAFFKDVLPDHPAKPFPVPPGISLVRINPVTGDRVSALDDHGIWESFIPGTEPDPDNPAPRLVLGQGNFSLPGHAVEKPVTDISSIVMDEDTSGDTDVLGNAAPDTAIVPVAPSNLPPIPGPTDVPPQPTPPPAAQPSEHLSGTGGVY
jgi:penicillin-binding protein 1A